MLHVFTVIVIFYLQQTMVSNPWMNYFVIFKAIFGTVFFNNIKKT